MIRNIEPFRITPSLEDEIAEAFHSSSAATFAPQPAPLAPVQSPLPPLPEYVSHKEGVNGLGKVTAEAVVRDYEETAKQVEELGRELKSLAARQETMLKELQEGVVLIEMTAKKYRAEGKRIFNEIENCSLLTSNVRELCNTLQEKILPKEEGK